MRFIRELESKKGLFCLNSFLFIIFVSLFYIADANNYKLFKDKPSLRCNPPYGYVEQSTECRANLIMETWKERHLRMRQEAVLPVFTEEQISLEIWKTIPEWDGFYEASTLGRIRSLDRIACRVDGSHPQPRKGRILANAIDWGYCLVTLTGGGRRESYRVHRLIGFTFLANPNNLPEVNHIDTIKTHNWVENLEWSTQLDNQRHARKNIKFNVPIGEKSGRSKLKNAEVVEIKKLLLVGTPKKYLAKIFNVKEQTIWGIVYGHNWKHITI